MGILSYHSAWAPGPQAKPDQLSGDPTRDFARFPSPWTSKGIVSGNVNIRQMFDFGEMLWIHDPTYRQAMKRLIGYFLTDIEFFDPRHSGELKEEDINSYREVLTDQLKIKTVIYTALCNLFAHGNILMSMLPPILRRMQCPSCKMIHPVDVVASPDNPEFRFKYHAKDARFEAHCPRCGYRGTWTVYNMKADYRRNVVVQFWNPKEFILHQSCITIRSAIDACSPGRFRPLSANGSRTAIRCCFPRCRSRFYRRSARKRITDSTTRRSCIFARIRWSARTRAAGACPRPCTATACRAMFLDSGK